ncbi:hypothetical protein SRHO_G00247750 [Serrasalmus rhombeus]
MGDKVLDPSPKDCRDLDQGWMGSKVPESSPNDDIPPSSQPRLFERLPERDNGSVAVIDVVIAGRIAAWQETMRSAELRYRCLLYRITAGTALSAPQQTCRAQP